MEIALVIKIVEALVVIVPSMWGVYKTVKAKKYREAMSLSDETLKGIIAAIELMPQTPTTKALKSNIQKMSTTLGTEKEKLADLVQVISNLLDEMGIKRDGDVATVLRAADAIRKANEIRKARIAPSLTSILLLMTIAILPMGVFGCCRQPKRLTKETIFPATLTEPAQIVVEFPAGTKIDDPITVEVDGRIQTVSPVPDGVSAR